MNIGKSIILLAAGAIASVMPSCTYDRLESTATEAYTRAFIKEFGIIDPEQDWNLARNTSVTVDVGEHADQVKVYAKYKSTYYLTADLVNISGRVRIPVDVPESCREMLVKIDGREYPCVPGGLVKAAQAYSRTADSGSSVTFTHNEQQYNVSITAGNATGDEEYYCFNAKQMGPILAPTTPVDYDGSSPITDATNTVGSNYYWGDYYSLSSYQPGMTTNPRTTAGGLVPENTDNVGKVNVFQDIRVTPESSRMVIYPMYWFTDDTHHLGVYLIGGDDKPVRGADGKIIIFPVYTQNKYRDGSAPWDIEYYSKGAAPSSGVEEDEIVLRQTRMPEALRAYWFAGNVLRYYNNPTELANFVIDYNDYYQNGGEVGQVYTTDWHGTTAPSKDNYEITDIVNEGTYNAHYSVVITFTRKANAGGGSTVPEALVEDGNGTWTKPIVNNNSCCYHFRDQMLMRSRGVSINISGWTGKIGFCSTLNGGITVYSQAQVNLAEKDLGRDVGSNNHTLRAGEEDWYQYSYAAFYFHPITKTLFYSIEDWTGGDGDADLNDMVFMVKGVDYIDSDQGRVPVKITQESSTDRTLSWIVAAEDMGSTDDFDFNDMVFKLSSITTNHTIKYNEYGDVDQTIELASSETTEIRKEIRIQAMAAGGQKNLWLHYNDGNNDYILGPDKVVLNNGAKVDDCEWHRWFGSHGNSMINTGIGAPVKAPASCVLGSYTTTTVVDNGEQGTPTSVTEGLWNEALHTFSVETYFQSAKNGTIQGFYVTVDTPAPGSHMESIGDDSGVMISPVNKGEAPQMFLIPDIGATVIETGEAVTKPWSWPKERTHIVSAYPRFRNWVESAASNADWHTDYSTSSAVIRPVD